MGTFESICVYVYVLVYIYIYIYIYIYPFVPNQLTLLDCREVVHITFRLVRQDKLYFRSPLEDDINNGNTLTEEYLG